MNSIPQQYIDAHKEFRSFMRTEKGEKGQFLTNLMEAAEIHLSRIISSNIDDSFTILYDESYSIENLVRYYVIIENHDEWLTVRNGHTSLKSLKYFLSLRSGKEGRDWLSIYETIKQDFLREQIERQQRKNKEKRFKEDFSEGNVIDSHYERRERDYKARLACIEHYGCKCAICGFDFEKRYGEIGKDFIEVHHIIPISNSEGEHMVDPINDLIPVCSNCHSILHRKRPDPYLPEDLKSILNEMGKAGKC